MNTHMRSELPNSQKQLRLRARLSDFQPISCTPELYDVLGYADAETCLQSFSEFIHIRGHNFLQIYRLAMTGNVRLLRTITVIDRKHRPVAHVTDVRIDHSAEVMDVNFEDTQIAMLSLATGETSLLVPGGSHPRYAPTGHIVYGVSGTLRAVGFDLERLEIRGDPFPVLEGVVTKNGGAASFALSRDGSLVYVRGEASRGARRRLVWVDREGNEEPLSAEPRAYTYPRIAPGGGRLALDVRDQGQDIWLWDFTRDTLTRLTFDAALDQYPVWTPDGRRVAFSSARDGAPNVYWKAANGTGAVERLSESDNRQDPYAFTPDGSQLVIREASPDQADNLRVVSLEGSEEPLLATEFSERNAELSPDGRFVAYESNASGQLEIYVRPFPAVEDDQWLISRGGGTQPLWSPDGSELFYLSPAGALMAVRVRTEPGFAPDSPELVLEKSYLISTGGNGRTYDISPDGERFLMIQEVESDDEASSTELILVQNWFDELKRLVPTDN